MKSKIVLAFVSALSISTVALAEDDVLSRIKPIGSVNVAGATQAADTSEAKPKAAPAAAAQAAAQAPEAAPSAPAAPKAEADPGAGLYAAKGCGGCHGADGKTTPMGTYPKLAGQQAEYLLAQMKDIKNGTRANGQTAIMKGIIAGVSEDEMQAIAKWLASQQP